MKYPKQKLVTKLELRDKSNQHGKFNMANGEYFFVQLYLSKMAQLPKKIKSVSILSMCH